MTNFAQELADAAIDSPERPAVRLDAHTLTYADLDGAVARVAGLLRDHNVGPGDRVGLQLPNVPDFPVIYQAVLRLGAVVVPMNPLLKRGEVAFHLSDSSARIMLAWHGFAEHAQAGSDEAGVECVLVAPGTLEEQAGGSSPVGIVVDRADDDPAVIIYTSGTTGTPKGATLTHANIRSGAEVGRELVGAGRNDVAVAALPLFHVFGMNSIMNTTLLARGLMTLVVRFDPATVLQVIQRDSSTIPTATPTNSRPSGYASRADPHSPSRCSRGSMRHSAPPSLRDTGCRRRPGWRRSTLETEYGSPARSASLWVEPR
jgi:long-chain acyl-CoA synthetase